MKDYGLVSIITPNYNCAQFLKETVESVQRQTYPYWEMIIIDDCSTDDSWLLLNDLAQEDNRIKVLKNEKNLGAAISRNYALREAKGVWIAFLDSDDLWDPLKLEKQIVFMLSNGYKFSYTNSENVKANGESLNSIESGPVKVGYYKLLLYNFLSTCSVMYSREAIGLIQIPNLKKRNDYAIWLIVSKKYPCYLLNENLTKYRIREFGSLSGKSNGLIGQYSLLKDHYVMFHESERFNPLVSCLLVCYNIVGYLAKKLFYIQTKN